MPRVRLNQELRFNPSGFGREIDVYPAGEQEVDEQVAAFVAVNPELGEVLAKKPSRKRTNGSEAAGDEETSEPEDGGGDEEKPE